MRQFTVLCCVLAVSLVFGDGPAIPWQQGGHDAARTSNSHLAVPVDGKVKWTNNNVLGGIIEGGACVSPVELIYFGTTGGHLICVNAITGSTVWSVVTGGAVHGTPALANDAASVFVADAGGYIAHYDALTGSLLDERYLGGKITTSVLITPDDLLYLTSSDGVLYCLKAATLGIVWVSQLDNADGSPALLGDLVFVASEKRKELLAWDRSTGDLKYSKALPGPADGLITDVAACPVQFWGGNGAVAVSNENVLSVWDPVEGDLMFNVTIGVNKFLTKGSAVAFGDDGTMYWGTPDGTVHAIESHGTWGKVLWGFTVGDAAVQSTPAIGPDELYVVSINGDFFALDMADGTQNWNVSLYPGITAPPALNDNGLLFIGTFEPSMKGIGTYEPSPGPVASHSPSPAPTGHHGGGLTAGGKAAVSIAVLAAVGLVGFFGYKRYQKHRSGGFSAAKTSVFSSSAAGTTYSTMDPEHGL